MRYWDSSALVSLLVDEAGSENRRAVLRQDPGIVTWWGSWVECAPAVCCLYREGAIDDAGLEQSLERLAALAGGWVEVRPLDRIRRRAIRLLRVHPLRAADALQLAAALTASAEEPADLEVVSSDARLSAAARREGFAVR
ncbi:MAG: PIN domain-containing protein [Acidobacteria bacterium]|nr:PIN domain-containing protein [Acidobacteriota bacterium]